MPATALICLDDFTLCGVVTSRFKLFGWRCLVGEFLRTALKHQPELVVVDAHADYLIKALKADARTARLTVVAIGRYGDLELKAKAIAAGALAVIARPIELDQFDTFTRFIEHGRSGAERGHPNKSHARPAPAAPASAKAA
ncbi:MAG: hypothetical protein JNK82_37840 [Myxococcaceae bacterium]|nr:hypothetical protein [Myxococcaceae bacterium]